MSKDKIRIYLSGAMTDVDEDISVAWRYEAIKSLVGAMCFNPWEYFDFESNIDNRQVMNYDLYRLKNSDIVLVNFDYNSKSLGTMAEIAIAHNLGIPIIGVHSEYNELHPWQINICEVIFGSVHEACNYITEFYLEE